jgi:sugar O-acyltransferase (sialic acid O-acetyltransferase NeuD family)
MTPDHTSHRQQILIYGAGGHGRVTADAAVAAGWNVIGFIDDHRAGERESDWPILTHDILGEHPTAAVHVAIGDGPTRQLICERMRHADRTLATIVHPTAWVSPSAELAANVYVGPQAAVNAAATIEVGAIVNTSAVVEHHGHMGPFSHLSPGAVLAGAAQLGAFSSMGTNASAIPRVRIGQRCVIGAGAAVIEDIADGQTVMGVPARPR